MNNFCAFILSNRRANHVLTYNCIKSYGYTGDIKIIIDDQDPDSDKYFEKYGDEVYQFCKQDAIDITDDGDNFETYNAVVYARNMVHSIAKEYGYDYFIVLDDDYNRFRYCIRGDLQLASDKYRTIRKNMDAVLDTMVTFIKNTPVHSIAMSQGGETIGGLTSSKPKRKCMNSFVCATDRPFQFVGKINEDVNAIVRLGSIGYIFITTMWLSLQQAATQANAGGLTDIYLDQGTYVKSFYSVMYNPSSVKVSVLKDRKNPRLHHRVSWNNAVPKILAEKYKRYGN